MKHLEIAKALNYLLPEAKFVLSGDTLEGLEWLDDRVLPTESKIVEAIEQIKAEEAQAETNKAQAKAAAEGKLAALGLTTDDLRALGL